MKILDYFQAPDGRTYAMLRNGKWVEIDTAAALAGRWVRA